jgi:hypothetical protein
VIGKVLKEVAVVWATGPTILALTVIRIEKLAVPRCEISARSSHKIMLEVVHGNLTLRPLALKA